MKISLHKNTDYKTASDNFHKSIADNIKFEMANLAEIELNNLSSSHKQIMKSKKIEELNHEYAHNIILTEIHSKILLNSLIDEHLQNKLKSMSFEFGLHNSQALIENYLELTKPKKNITESVDNSQAVDNLFYLNPLVKQEITAIYQNFKDDKKQLVLNLFNWLVNAIEYDENHRDDIYRNATETFISGKGLCGEMAILLIATFRYFNINASFVEVTVDDKNKPVAHACVSVIIDGKEQLIDPAYKSFEIKHQSYKVLTDDELLERFRYWNRSRIEDYSIPLSTSQKTYPMPKSRLGSFLKRRKFNPSVADKKWVDENLEINNDSDATMHTEAPNLLNERFVFPFDKLYEGFQKNESEVERVRISFSKNNKKQDI
jgi:translation initiation factor 2 beta subunit (eIF-2beta)/eIF-5